MNCALRLILVFLATAFGCRCGGQYCTKHRLAKEHNCTFDYRRHGIEELKKSNPKITPDKFKKS